MPKFLIEYTTTEITRDRVWIEAESEAEAISAVEEYEFDNSESYQVDSMRWEVSDVAMVEQEVEE